MLKPAEIFRVQSNLRVEIDRQRVFDPPAALEELVMDIWRTEKAQRGDALFDGTIFSADTITPTLIRGHWIPYRYALTGYRHPETVRAAGVLPMAVNGLTRCRGRILLARRSPYVAASPNMWELAPSGGVDPEAIHGDHIDIRRSLLQELHEEVGFFEEDIMRLSPFAVVRDESSLELCFWVDLKDDAMDRFDPPIDEYRDFEWVSPEEWPAFCEGKSILEITKLIFEEGIQKTEET